MLRRFVSAIAAAAVSVSVLCFGVSAEVSDVKIDCEKAKEAVNWGKSISVPAEQFELARITDKTQVVITFDIIDMGGETEMATSPVTLAIQADKDPENINANDNGGVWADIQPNTYDEMSATFYYSDLVKGYGSKDFTKVTYFYVVAPTKVKIKATKIYISDCNDTVPETTTTTEAPAETSAPEETTTPAETTTVAATSAAATTSQAESSSSSNVVLFAIIGVVCGVALAVAIIFVIVSKKSDKAFDTQTGKFVSKKKLK